MVNSNEMVRPDVVVSCEQGELSQTEILRENIRAALEGLFGNEKFRRVFIDGSGSVVVEERFHEDGLWKRRFGIPVNDEGYSLENIHGSMVPTYAVYLTHATGHPPLQQRWQRNKNEPS
jgi:hypothetical protein